MVPVPPLVEALGERSLSFLRQKPRVLFSSVSGMLQVKFDTTEQFIAPGLSGVAVKDLIMRGLLYNKGPERSSCSLLSKFIIHPSACPRPIHRGERNAHTRRNWVFVNSMTDC